MTLLFTSVHTVHIWHLCMRISVHYICTLYLYTISVHYICTLYLYTISVHNSQGVYTHNRYTLDLIQHMSTGVDSLNRIYADHTHTGCVYLFNFALTITSAHINIRTQFPDLFDVNNSLLTINTSAASYSTGTIASISCINVLVGESWDPLTHFRGHNCTVIVCILVCGRMCLHLCVCVRAYVCVCAYMYIDGCTHVHTISYYV